MNRRLLWAMAAAAGTGFVSLGYEILWYRVYAYGTGGTLPVFGIFLGIYLVGIAFGALWAQRLCKDASPDTGQRIARWAGGLTATAGTVAYLHIPVAVWFAENQHVMGAMPFAGLAAGLYGAVLPLVGHVGVPANRRAGQGVGFVYFANIVGASLGSLLAGFVFLEHLGTATSATLLLATSACLVALLLRGAGSAWAGRVRHGVSAGVLLLAAFAIGFPAHQMIYERLLWRSPNGSDHPFATFVENRSGIVAVSAGGTVFGGGVYDGRLNTSLSTDTNLIVRAYALAGLHPNPRRILMIGLGSGSWAQVVAHHPRLQKLTVVEINPGYLEVLRRHREVSSLLDNPKVEFVIDDGRRWLNAAPEQAFDVILSNTSFYWRANSTHILSKEFLALAASRLANGGIVYLNTTFSLAAARTACASFHSGLRFFNFVAVGNAPVTFDTERFKATLRTYRIDGQPPFDGGSAAADPWLAENLQGLLAPSNLETCGDLLARSESARVITDDNMAGETDVPWNFSFQPPVPD